MLHKAKKWYTDQGIRNVILLRADIGSLPIRAKKVDGCISMNGFHAFPDKTLALRELTRVMKSNKNLASCFYVKSKRKLTDFVVINILQKQGAFPPPFFCEEEVLSVLNRVLI